MNKQTIIAFITGFAFGIAAALAFAASAETCYSTATNQVCVK